MPEYATYLAHSLAWSVVWLLVGYLVMTTYISKGHL